MATRVVTKETKTGQEISEEHLSLINLHTRRDFTKEELYTFPVILCDNEIDRDHERFPIETLKKFIPLFLGRTGIMDHQWKAGNQNARLYHVEVIKESGQKNSLEEDYAYLKGYAYMVITESNKDLIAEIDAGIKKEVSIGFSISEAKCSICGNSIWDYEECPHIPGREYTEKGSKSLCYVDLLEPKDAYEWSFVAVPAQPGAGVVKKAYDEKQKHIGKNKEETKKYLPVMEGGLKLFNLKEFIVNAKEKELEKVEVSVKDLEDIQEHVNVIELAKETEEGKVKGLEDKVKELEPKAEMGSQYVDDLKKECLRLGALVDKNFNADVMEKVYDKCDVEELKTFKEQFEKQVDELFPPSTQTTNSQTKSTDADTTDAGAYKVSK